MYQRLIVGDSYEFTTVVPDYPASDGWTLAHVLRARSGSNDAITMTAVASGDDYLTTVLAATSGGWDAGDYTVTAQVSNVGLERHTLDAVALSDGRLRSNLITLLANPSEGEAFDDRTHARIVLDAIEAVIEGRATKDQEEYTIKDRSLKRTPLADLVEFERIYRARVLAEEAAARRAAGLPDGRTSYVSLRRV